MTSFLLALLAAGSLHRATTPHAIVQALYAPYLADPHANSGKQVPDDETEIRDFASKSLKRAIDADRACEKREQGICNLDFDMVIAGQDWDISKFAIADGPATADKQVIRATFDNGGPVEVRFFFVRESGAWKIDDVEDLRPKDDPIRRDLSMKKVLRGQS